LAGTLAILTEVLHGFSSVPPVIFQDSTLRPWLLPSKSFPVHHSSVILPFNVILSRCWQCCKINHKIKHIFMKLNIQHFHCTHLSIIIQFRSL
jgi:hypothetical protein